MYKLGYSLILVVLANFSQAQTEAKISGEEILVRYFKAIGGKERWENLESRKAKENLSLFVSSGLMEMEDEVLDYTKYFQAPNSYLDLWFQDMYYSTYVQTPGCVWYYLDKSISVLFPDKKYRKREATFPRIGVLEILNFPMVGSVFLENDSYRVDFEDKFWKRVMSVYFDRESFLITKHSYTDLGGDYHEYLYKDYQEKDGYLEPYLIENYVDSKKYKAIRVKSIDYNLDIDPTMFTPPTKCISKSESVTVPLKERMPFIF